MFKDILLKTAGYFVGLSQKTGGEISGDKALSAELIACSRNVAAEGIVLLKNIKQTLPLTKSNNLAVFGRVQYNYFYVGYGSGGDVKSPYYVNLAEGLQGNGNIKINKDLSELYASWCKENVPYEGFWGHWPLNFNEMPLTDEIVNAAAQVSDVALVVIGRAAGEDRDQSLIKGGFYITDEEMDMLNKVTERFSKVVVLINSGNIIDLSWTKEYGDKITALLYVWQGGMESGNAIADVLSGDISPSGKLTDTIANNYQCYPTCGNFGNKKYNNYVEDIFVGYRYFETFGKDKVLFPFGFGLSYTDFELKSELKSDGDKVSISVVVKNIGKKYSGKETVQIYVEAPQGKLGKAKRSLVSFEKTRELKPNEEEVLSFEMPIKDLMSYDDKGVSGHKSCYIAEAGKYAFYVGTNLQNANMAGEFELKQEIVKQMEEICAVEPKNCFKAICAKEEGGKIVESLAETATITANLKNRIIENMPKAISQTADKGIKLIDVKNGKATLDQFVAQLSVEELEILCRGHLTMASPLGAAGNAGAFGGISESLRAKGVPPVIVTDGPSGIRLSTYASLLPCGTAQASSWNTALIEKLYLCLAEEMLAKGTDVLLGPGINIHRDPLCGRNFEYFSEDPLVSGNIAAAVVKGLQGGGASACVKHFACNNQEINRSNNDTRVSERALREIYLKAFEICVKESAPFNIMTSYNKINGIFSYNNYDLCTTVLRKEWGYKGNVMTDWWTKRSVDPNFNHIKNSAYRIRAQVDVLMPGGDRRRGKYDKSALKSYKKGALTLPELQRSAKNVLNFIITCKALDSKLKQL